MYAVDNYFFFLKKKGEDEYIEMCLLNKMQARFSSINCFGHNCLITRNQRTHRMTLTFSPIDKPLTTIYFDLEK